MSNANLKLGEIAFTDIVDLQTELIEIITLDDIKSSHQLYRVLSVFRDAMSVLYTDPARFNEMMKEVVTFFCIEESVIPMIAAKTEPNTITESDPMAIYISTFDPAMPLNPSLLRYESYLQLPETIRGSLRDIIIKLRSMLNTKKDESPEWMGAWVSISALDNYLNPNAYNAVHYEKLSAKNEA